MNRRVERVQSLVRQELGRIIQQEIKDPRVAGLVSVTEVQLTPDLRLARVFLSFYGSDEGEQAALAALNKAKPFLRRELGAHLDLRFAPNLDLHIDRSMAYADQVNRLLKTLPPSAEE